MIHAYACRLLHDKTVIGVIASDEMDAAQSFLKLIADDLDPATTKYTVMVQETTSTEVYQVVMSAETVYRFRPVSATLVEP